jgi:hypothetical protein
MATIPTAGSFDPPDTKADEGALAEESGYIQAHGGRIIGRGTEVVTQMRTSAVEFSELVAAPLAREGGKFENAAHTAMQGAVYGSMVTNQWATWVTEFKAARLALIAEWEAAVGDSFGIRESEVGGGTPNLTPAERAEATAEATGYAGQLKLAEMNAKANALYEKFKGQAADIGGMLKGGPTPENLRALAAGGVGTWMGFNVFGLDMALPVTGQDGQDLVDALNAALKSGEPLSPELREQLETLFMVAQRAGNLQDLDDADLTAGELGFLQVLYGALDTTDGGEPGRLYDIAGLIADSGFSKDDQQFALAALGGGLIALSNPAVGGGTNRLPDPLRKIIDLYAGREEFGRHPKTLIEMLTGIAPMLDATGRKVTVNGEQVDLGGLKAGREFSTALVYSVADIVDTSKWGPKLHPTEMYRLDDVIGGVMEVATRDRELNADLLTGQVKHPVYGDDSVEHLLRGVFGRNWEDDGKAAAKLIDWIPGALNGADPFLQRDAAESYASVMNTMTSGDVNGAWKESAFDFFTDGYGKMNGFDNAPIGMANPHIAKALASSTIPFLDYFADPEAKIEVDGEMVERDTAVNWAIDPADRGAYFNMTDRARMFELVMGSKDAANTLGEAVYAKIYLDGYNMPGWRDDDGHADFGLPGGNDGEGAQGYARRTGRLLGFLQAGYDAVHADGVEDAAGVTASNKQESAWMRAGAAIAKEIVTTVPGLKPGKAGWDVLVKEAFEVGKWGPNVTESQGWAFGGVDAPGKGDGPMTLERIDVMVGYNVVDGLTSDPDSGRTVKELAELSPNLVVEDPKTGDLRLKTPDEIEKGDDPLNGPRYDLDDALKAYRAFLGPGNTTRYNEYTSELDDMSEEYRERYAR